MASFEAPLFSLTIRAVQPIVARTKKDYMQHKEEARVLVHKKLAELNAVYSFVYNKVSIKNQKDVLGELFAQRQSQF